MTHASIPDVVLVRQAGDAAGDPFAIELTDERVRRGVLSVDVAPESGHVDDLLCASSGVASLPGTQTATVTLQLGVGAEAPAVTIYKRGDSLLLQLGEAAVLRPALLPSGDFAFEVCQPPEGAYLALPLDAPGDCPLGCDCVACRAAERHDVVR